MSDPTALATGGQGSLSTPAASLATAGYISFPTTLPVLQPAPEVPAPAPAPPRPTHVKHLRPGDVVRVAMKAGYHLNPLSNPKANPRLRSPTRGRPVMGFSRTVFFAFVVTNDPTVGELRVVVQQRPDSSREQMEGLIHYKNILYIHLYVTDELSMVETAPATHPGARAFGTFRRAQLGTHLIRLKR